MNPNNQSLHSASRGSLGRSGSLPSTIGKYAILLMLGIAMLSQSAYSAASYGTAVMANNPLAFWQLNETGDPTTGTLPAVDATGNGFDGTNGTTSYNGLYGILGPQPPTYLGFTNGQGAVLFTDINSPIRIPLLNLNTNTVTIAMWIKPTNNVSTFRGLFMNRNSGGDAEGFGFGGQTSGGMAALGYTWNNNSGATWGYNSGLFPVTNTWQFVALVIQSNSATIYLYYVDTNTGANKLLSAVNPIAHSPAAFTNGLTLIGDDVVNGNAPDNGRVFPGAIAGTAVYKSALTQDQILALFAAGVGVSGFPPSITGQPRSQYVLSGSTAKIAATGIGGSSPFIYQWQLNGTNVNLLPNSANYTGANTNTLTILSASANEVGSYHLLLTNSVGSTVSSNATLNIQSPSLVGEWFTNGNLADISGYAPVGKHDGYAISNGIYMFTNDVPTGKTGQSLWLFAGNTGIAISNSSTFDTSYTNTFDDRINSAMTVQLWAKGWPSGQWNPFASKFGESGQGWQLRRNGGSNPTWTVRGTGAGDDMAANGLALGDTNNWHFYVGTFDVATGARNLYVDGQLVASQTNNSIYTMSPASFLCIGARDNGGQGTNFGNFFNGQIYDARVYNYSRTLAQVLGDYGVISPSISVQPQPTSVFAGEQAKVSAVVGGTPPLSYQWRLNGTNVNLLPDIANFTGANSNVLTILGMTTNDAGSYSLFVTNLYGTVLSSNALVTVAQPALVGRWFNGSSSLADVSGYRAPGTHDGYPVGVGSYAFDSDVPAGFAGQSLSFSTADSAIAISNSSTASVGYTNTFDGVINSHMTVTVWAKGTRDSWSWNPWVSKNGEGGNGWQLRTGGAGVLDPCWTVREGGNGVYTLGCGPGWSPPGDQADLHAAFSGAGQDADANRVAIDNNWHFYAGTFNAVTGVRNLYVDGVLRGQETNNTLYNLAANAPLTIGGRLNTGNTNFEAFSIQKIFDVRVYNADLTSDQIVALMPDPVITVQPPQSLNAYISNIVQISVTTLTLSTPVTNQWQHEGTNLLNGAFGNSTVVGANSTTLKIGNVTPIVQGVYRLIVSDPHGTVISSNTTVTVLSTVAPPTGNLVGAWLTGSANLADTSGFRPAGTHDGHGVVGSNTPASNYAFTSDVPLGWSGQSLSLLGNTTIAISNSSTLDAGYVNTFDDTIVNTMTVSFWAKGWPDQWNPFVSKYGEGTQGWQLRRNGGSNPLWTIRGTGATEDMSASIVMSNDGQWHHYAGTFNFDINTFTGVRNLYVDGALVASQAESLYYTLASTSYLSLGGRDNGGANFGNYFTGKMYNARIYNVALTEAQINSLAHQELAAPAPAFSGPPVLSNNKLVLAWSGGTLLQSTNVLGPWTPVVGATSPYTNDLTTSPQRFFRLSNP